tara:strand:- start:1440 stop:1874 length:435 start_codon:yes stop_codon:yes gene_type:complete
MNKKTADRGQDNNDSLDLNGCKDPMILEWAAKAWEYEATILSSASTSIDGWDHFLQGHLPQKEIEHLSNTECLFVDFINPFDQKNDHTAVLIASKQPVVLIFVNFTDDEDDQGWIEFQGVMDLQNFWDYMDSLPNMNKFFRPRP